MPHMERLCLPNSWKYCGGTGTLQSLQACLLKLRNITELHVTSSDCDMCAPVAVSIITALPKLKKLDSLMLHFDEDLRFGKAGPLLERWRAAALALKGGILRRLHLCLGRWVQSGEAATCVAESFMRLTHLQELHLHMWSALDDKAAAVWKTFFGSTGVL